MWKTNTKVQLERWIDDNKDRLIEYCSELIQFPTENPPSDTRQVLKYIEEIVKNVEGAEIDYYTFEEPIVNAIIKLKGNGSGKRLVFNGHLDTFPIGDKSLWTLDPFSGVLIDGRIYGRGASDMKGGVASYLMVLELMSQFREHWQGDLVITLVGDEENMGLRGAKPLLENIEDASGHAMISGDVGTPRILRFGEKGQVLFVLNAEGKSAHGAHVHMGINAIDRLVEGIVKINALKYYPVNPPDRVRQAILEASEISEGISGKGESKVLQSVTVNFGVIEGGIAPNLMPAKASAECSIRIPVGVTVEEILERLDNIVDSIEGLYYEIIGTSAPNWSDIDHEIFSIVKDNAENVLKERVVINMRIGSSDAKYYRLVKDIPSITCGLTPYNMGAPDEYIEIDELVNITRIHALSAFDYLTS